MNRKSNIDTVRMLKVIEVMSYFGEGTKESPGRQIAEYYSMEGVLLARVDAYDYVTSDNDCCET